MNLPPRPLMIWLRPPSDISTARTIAWSLPTRAWDTLLDAVEVWAPAPGVATPARGTGGRIGWRHFALARFLPLRLIYPQASSASKPAPFAPPAPPAAPVLAAGS